MRVEKLEPHQYPVLKTIADGYMPDPRNSLALVVRSDSDDLVGRIFLFQPVHVEGPWVREDLRGSTIGKRLIDSAEHEARLAGVKVLYAYAVNGTIENYLLRLGFKKSELTVWTKEL